MSISNVNFTIFRYSSKSKCRNNADTWLYLVFFFLPSDRNFPDYLLISEVVETQMGRLTTN